MHYANIIVVQEVFVVSVPDIWVTSDGHHGHNKIIELCDRPFKDGQEMDEVLIQKWNAKVKPNDLIIHTGDAFLCKTKRMQYIASRLNGRKILVRGNHDHFTNKKYFDNGFKPYTYFFFENFLFSHYPQNEQGLLLAKEYGLAGNVHGHVHNNLEGLNPEVHFCACVENHDYSPVHIDTIKAFFK